jgi:multicomponent Na+:H+ antiporter subunit B
MSEIVKTVSRILCPLIFVFGIYVTIHGHLTPGGGFAGGAILAGSIFLGILAYGVVGAIRESPLQRKKRTASISEASGILLFWLIAVVGFVMTGTFFLNFLGQGHRFHVFSGGIIPLCNIAIAIEVGAAISAILLALVLFRRET